MIKKRMICLVVSAITVVLLSGCSPTEGGASNIPAGVLWVRFAIANVNLKKKKRGLLSFTPGGFALRTLKDATGSTVLLNSAILEAELLDSYSGERLAALVDTQSAADAGKPASWDALEESLSFYAKRFRRRLDEAHGR